MSKPISERAMSHSVAGGGRRREAYTAAKAPITPQTERFLFASQQAETNGKQLPPRPYRKRRRVANWLRLALGIAALVALLAKHL